MSISRLVPTMFHRRLLLLGALIAAAAVALAAQLVVLTVVRGDELRRDAEARLESVQWLPTVRGRILDRTGRVLAQDRPSFDVTFDYGVLDGSWAEGRAGRAARRLHRASWRDLDQDERRALVERYAEVYRRHVEACWERTAAAAGVPRGQLESRRRAIVERVESLADRVYRARQGRGITEALARGREITTEVEDEINRGARVQLREAESPHVVLAHVPDAVAFELSRLAAQTTDLVLADGRVLEAGVPLLPGVALVHSADREYPFDEATVRIDRSTFPSPIAARDTVEVTVRGVGIHVLGWMGRDASADDVNAREERLRAAPEANSTRWIDLGGRRSDRGSYEPGDSVGRCGVEAGREDVLRGLRGVRVVRFESGEQREIAAEPGRDVTLTIDAMLQARVQAIMTPSLGLAAVQEWHALPTTDDSGRSIPATALGTPLSGAAVVLDIESGDVLAMVSTPGFTRDDVRERPEAVFGGPEPPYVNRAVAGAYPPGSVAKALLLAAAVTLGRHALDHPIECTGHLLPNQPDALRCWIYKRSQAGGAPVTHTMMLGHALDAREALMVSCNIYFFTLGRQLGIDGIRRAYGMFGLGEHWDLGLARPGRDDGEFGGRIGSVGASELTLGDAIQMGIGQGPVAWTPLHAANAVAILARGGARVPPRLVRPDGRAQQPAPGVVLDPGAVAAAMDGLSLSVNDPHGTGHSILVGPERRENIFNCPGVHVWGKTGTADAPPLVFDPDGDGPAPPRTVRDGDHSWFVVLAGPEGGPPRYAVAVLMEYAGSGGKVSGPIANQILHALRAEGYL